MTDRNKGRSRQFGMIDLETGEVFEDGVPVWVGAKVKWHEDWFMGFQGSFAKVASDDDMTFDMVKVWLYLLGNIGFENWVATPQVEIAHEVKLHKVNVSKAIKALIEKGLLIKGPKLGRTTALKLNSQYAWKGKIKNLSSERIGILKDFQLERQKRSELENQ